VKNIATNITTVDKVLDFMGEPKTCTRNIEDDKSYKNRNGRGGRRAKGRKRRPRLVGIILRKQMK